MADSADDVCPVGVDPCLIAEVVRIVVPVGAGLGQLDFGTRQVRLIQGGQIDVGGDAGILQCGEFLATVQGSIALKVAEGFTGGFLTISARGQCTGNRSVPCLSSVTCTRDGIGTCDASGANVTLVGKADGSAESPGSLTLDAAGSIIVGDTVNMRGTTLDSDGGEIELNTFAGDITVAASLLAISGNASTGGSVTIDAGGNVDIDALIDVSGGEGDGGAVDITAIGDIGIRAEIRAVAKAFDGFGGEVAIDAGGDLLINGGSAGGRQLIRTNGSGAFEGSGGDGGAQSYDASGSITIGEFVRMEANGARPDGFGEEVALFAAGDILIGGDIEAVARGIDGFSGIVDIDSGGRVEIFSTSQIDASGSGASGTDEIAVLADSGFIHRGVMDISSGGSGTTGNIRVDVGGDIDIYGTMLSDGHVSEVSAGVLGLVSLSGCRVTVATGARIDNKTDFGGNELIGREGVVIETGAVLLAGGASGTNTIVYRSAGPAPAVSGSVLPTASQSANDLLLICPVCGNSVVEPGETCDDGNAFPGDGCTERCQDQGCVDQTPGYPVRPLCADDTGCTVDSCDSAAHSCVHFLSCDDHIDCTVDVCRGTACVNAPDSSLCDDGNVCTGNLCVRLLGCRTSEATGSCEDGLACTVSDQCVEGVCRGTSACAADQTCSDQTGTCVSLTTTTVSTTTTTLSSASCGDGFVQGGEQCDAGSSNGLTGAACGGNCRFRECGNPNGDARVTASDALFTLRVAVGSAQCDLCICDVAPSGGTAGVTASDALMLLRVSVGIPIALSCSLCSP